MRLYEPRRQPPGVSFLEGLWIWDGKSWRSRRFFGEAEPDKVALSLLIDNKGRIWIRQVNRLFRLETFDSPLVEVASPVPLSLVDKLLFG